VPPVQLNNHLFITPPPVPNAGPVDPTERWLNTRPGTLLEQRAGDACSLLGIVGAATIAINRRSPAIEELGEKIVLGSMAASGVDTAIQGRNVLKDGGRGAEQRGGQRSTWGTVAYAATGLIPAASIAALEGLHRHPSSHELAGLAIFAANGGMLGYEVAHRGGKIMRGEEDLSGYGSLLAAGGGFVVAQHITRV
jgi:hypothetical protein